MACCINLHGCLPKELHVHVKPRRFAHKLNSYVDHVSEQDRVVERRLSTRTNLNRTNERVPPKTSPLSFNPFDARVRLVDEDNTASLTLIFSITGAFVKLAKTPIKPGPLVILAIDSEVVQ